MKLNYFFLIVLIILFFSAYFYFSQVNPVLEKPIYINEKSQETNKSLSNFENLNLSELNKINTLLYTLELNKLHKNILENEKPIFFVEINKEESDELYVFKIENQKIELTDFKLSEKGKLNKDSFRTIFDIGIIIKADALEKNLSGLNEIVENIKKNNIIIEIYANEKDLLLKGYKVLYDKFKNKLKEDSLNENISLEQNNFPDNKITFNIIRFVNSPLRTLKVFNLYFIIIFALIVGLIIKREHS